MDTVRRISTFSLPNLDCLSRRSLDSNYRALRSLLQMAEFPFFRTGAWSRHPLFDSSLVFSLSLFLRHAITISSRASDSSIFLLYRASLYAPRSSNMIVSAIIDHRPLHSPSRSCGQFKIGYSVLRSINGVIYVVGSLNIREM